MGNRLRKLSETDIKKQIKDYLSFFPDVFHFSLMGGLGCYRGQPDMIVVKEGKVFFIEVKTKTGIQSKYQIEFEAKLKRVGGNYHLVRSVDEVMKLLEI